MLDTVIYPEIYGLSTPGDAFTSGDVQGHVFSVLDPTLHFRKHGLKLIG